MISNEEQILRVVMKHVTAKTFKLIVDELKMIPDIRPTVTRMGLKVVKS